MHLDRSLACMASLLLLSAAMGLLLVSWSLAYPVPYLLYKLMATYGAFLLLGLVLSLFLRPGFMETVYAADALGLKERVITAVELWGDSGEVASLQRNDALRAVENADFRRMYRIKAPVRRLSVSIALAVLTALLFFMPTKARDEARHVENLKETVEKQMGEVEKARMEALSKGLTPMELSEIDKLLRQVKEELKTADTEEEILKALSRAKNEVETVREFNPEPDAGKVLDVLSKHDFTRGLAEIIKNGTADDLKRMIESAAGEISRLDEEGRKQLAEEIKKAAEEVAANDELAKALNDLARALMAEGGGSLDSALQSLGDMLFAMAQRDARLAEALDQYRKALQDSFLRSLDEVRRSVANRDGGLFGRPAGESGNGDGDNQGSEDGRNANGQGGSQPGNGQSQQGGNGNSSESGQDNGQAGQSGQGNQNGSAGNMQNGQGPNGNANGNSSGNPAQGGNQSGGSGAGGGGKNVRDYESIYVPRRLGDDENAEESHVQGSKGSQGSSRWSEAEGIPVEKGTVLPYNEVLGQYRDAALKNLGDSGIPPGMEQLVRDYFTSLE